VTVVVENQVVGSDNASEAIGLKIQTQNAQVYVNTNPSCDVYGRITAGEAAPVVLKLPLPYKDYDESVRAVVQTTIDSLACLVGAVTLLTARPGCVEATILVPAQRAWQLIDDAHKRRLSRHGIVNAWMDKFYLDEVAAHLAAGIRTAVQRRSDRSDSVATSLESAVLRQASLCWCYRGCALGQEMESYDYFQARRQVAFVANEHLISEDVGIDDRDDLFELLDDLTVEEAVRMTAYFRWKKRWARISQLRIRHFDEHDLHRLCRGFQVDDYYVAKSHVIAGLCSTHPQSRYLPYRLANQFLTRTQERRQAKLVALAGTGAATPHKQRVADEYVDELVELAKSDGDEKISASTLLARVASSNLAEIATIPEFAFLSRRTSGCLSSLFSRRQRILSQEKERLVELVHWGLMAVLHEIYGREADSMRHSQAEEIGAVEEVLRAERVETMSEESALLCRIIPRHSWA
jgi:hypothetical protein